MFDARIALTLTIACCGVLCAVGCSRSTAPDLRADLNVALELREVLDRSGAGGAVSAAASLGEPTGFGTLRGTFRISGSPPPRRPQEVNKDLAICAPGGNIPLDESVVVGPGNGLKNVLIFLDSQLPADDPAWEHSSYIDAKFAEVEFDQKQCIFLSHVFAMRSTQKMRILNSDPIAHNTKIEPRRGPSGANPTITANSSDVYEPKKQSSDPFPVSCSLHPWMRAYMITRDSPYFAVTDEQGQFEIANVPAGVPLEFRVWQETAEYLQSVTVDDQPATWSKGRFTITLPAGGAIDMNVVVDASVF